MTQFSCVWHKAAEGNLICVKHAKVSRTASMYKACARSLWVKPMCEAYVKSLGKDLQGVSKGYMINNIV